jgi:hypothetical protein
MNKMEELKTKLRIASANMLKCAILPAGEHGFEVREAKIEHDSQRNYDYLYVLLRCTHDDQQSLTSDRFPVVDNMLWKLADFLAAIGVEVDALMDTKELVHCFI